MKTKNANKIMINGIRISEWELIQWEEAEKTGKAVRLQKGLMEKIINILARAMLGHY